MHEEVWLGVGAVGPQDENDIDAIPLWYICIRIATHLDVRHLISSSYHCRLAVGVVRILPAASITH
jgi:hypothetical protein